MHFSLTLGLFCREREKKSGEKILSDVILWTLSSHHLFLQREQVVISMVDPVNSLTFSFDR